MISVLSTKKLSAAHLQLFSDYYEIDDYDAIQIKPLEFMAPPKIENAIVTSQNSAKFIIGSDTKIEHFFCVGKKTELFLVKNGQKVKKCAQNAQDLANFIAKQHKNDSFWFFSGTRRREEIPKALKMAKIKFFEQKTYKTDLNSLKFDKNYQKIMFFSPSGVESYITSNQAPNGTAICIGKTTASEAKKHFKKVLISKDSTIESVIETTLTSTN